MGGREVRGRGEWKSLDAVSVIEMVGLALSLVMTLQINEILFKSLYLASWDE